MRSVLKNKIILICSGAVMCLVIFICIFYCIVFSSLKLVGSSNIEVNYQQEYKDAGVTFKLFGFDHSDKISVSDNIDIKTIGKYKVIYRARFLIFFVKKERIVNIVDKEPPVIKLKGENCITICPNSNYIEDGYEAVDEYDGDITDKVNKKVVSDEILYEVTDSSGNRATIKRKVSKIDQDAPIIKLKGSQTVYIKINSKYNDFGYDISDNCDMNPNVDITSNLDTSKPGNYIINYSAVDSSGNLSSISREVVVVDNSGIGIIYLTFDDGPSDTGSTIKILDILKSEGVKATFFVTNRGSDSLIKREYNDGHVIALHTATHDYSYVYSSVNNYFNDLKSVQDRVYSVIGYRPKIIRFPGGSNNTVSNKYSSGIMDILTDEVIKQGYNYFDWNVSSQDVGGCTSSDCVYNSVVKNLSKNKINIVLMHDTKMITADALRDIIIYGKINGYLFKVIDENTNSVKFK